MTVIKIKGVEGVPDYEVIEFSRPLNPYCFIVIVFNEGERFTTQLMRMGLQASRADLIVAERRSTDGSTQPEFLKSHGVASLLTTDERGGATSIRMAFHYALARGYKGIILVDGNGKDGVDALPRFVEKLEEGYDFVQGSRFMPGGYHKNTPLARYIGIRCIMNPLLWLGGGFWYTDGMNGFRGYSRAYLEAEGVEPLRDCFQNFNLQYYLSIRAPAGGFRTIEIPVSRVYPDDGAVPTKVTGFRRNWLALWEMVYSVMGGYNPGRQERE